MEAEIEGEALELGEMEAEAAVRPDVTLPKILTSTAPVTVKSVAVPTLPKLTPSRVTDLRAWIDHSGWATAALSAFLCPPIFVFLLD